MRVDLKGIELGHSLPFLNVPILLIQLVHEILPPFIDQLKRPCSRSLVAHSPEEHQSFLFKFVL